MRAANLVFAISFLAVPAQAQSFASKGLVGFARIASNARDSQGETLGGFGSGMAIVPGSLKLANGNFTGSFAMLPDRGWNTEGTTDYQARLQYFDFSLTPENGVVSGKTGLTMKYRKALLLTDGNGAATTGLDATGVRSAGGGFPDLPIAENKHVSLDSEAVAMPGDGSFWLGDEYGAYVYHFNTAGKMLSALRPPDAFIPMRGGKENFSANSPPRGEQYDTGNPQSGRQNNQGFEGVSITPDHKHLFVINQSALIQDLDPANIKATRRHVRLLDYDISAAMPKLVHEYVVPLPLYSDGKAKDLVAAQSEMLALNDHQLLLLCRDSGGGFTGKRDASAYRAVNIIDADGATDIMGKYDGIGGSVAPSGVLRPDIKPARLTLFLDMNDNAQLNRFGLHNGAPNDTNDLYEKWESMALASAHDPKAPDDYFLFIGSDNDFITQDGVMDGKPYKDAAGANVDTLVLAYRVNLPGISITN